MLHPLWRQWERSHLRLVEAAGTRGVGVVWRSERGLRWRVVPLPTHEVVAADISARTIIRLDQTAGRKRR